MKITVITSPDRIAHAGHIIIHKLSANEFITILRTNSCSDNSRHVAFSKYRLSQHRRNGKINKIITNCIIGILTHVIIIFPCNINK